MCLPDGSVRELDRGTRHKRRMVDGPLTSYQRPQFLFELGCALLGTEAGEVGVATGTLTVGVIIDPSWPPGGLEKSAHKQCREKAYHLPHADITIWVVLKVGTYRVNIGIPHQEL